MEIPYAVSILNKDEFKNLKGYGLDEILSSVPGVLAQSRSGNQDIRLVIRGFGARGSGDRSNSGTSRGIRIMLDGIPETEPDGRTSFDNLDLSLANSIEIIRSNASALWGNAAGGLLNISTVPSFDNYFIRIQGMQGSFGFNKYIVQAGSEIGNGMVYGTFAQNNFEGWRNRSSSFRSIFNLGFISNFSAGTKLGVHITAVSNVFHIPGPLSQAQYDSDPKQSNPTYEANDERRFNRLGRIGINFDHALNESNEISAMVYLNPKFLIRSERGTFRHFNRYHIGGNILYKHFTDFSSIVENKFVAGVDKAYQDGAILFYNLDSVTHNSNGVIRDDKREGHDNTGIFLQNELIINDKLSIILGGRYDNVTYYAENFLDPIMGFQSKSFEKFTPKAGISYRLTPLFSIYANMGGGVEVPAGNETDPVIPYGHDTLYLINPLLNPIISTTYEAGTKQLYTIDNFLNSISFDLAFYYINIKNDIVPYRGGRFYFTVGKSSRTGLEFGTQLNFKYGISLQGSFTYSNNKYNDYLLDSTLLSPSRPGIADFSGNKVAGLPDIYYYAGITIAPEIFYGAYLSLNTNGVGKYFVDDANKIEVPSYNILNASIGLNKPVSISEHFNLRVFIGINNMTDTKYAASAFINPDRVSGVPVYLEPGLPRSYVVSLILGLE